MGESVVPCLGTCFAFWPGGHSDRVTVLSVDDHVPSTNHQERLNLHTPREGDVYEVWREHPDWSHAQVGYAVYMPAPYVIRR
jgi:hypothetical protein